MIMTVTLNAAIDKTYEMDSFKPDRLNRTRSEFSEPGGKGVNVAKVLKILGIPVVASGIVGGYNGRKICSLLDHIGLNHEFISIEDESRLCLNVIDGRTGRHTEILESGPEIEQTQWENVRAKLYEMAAKSEYVILSGSLPRGLREEAYAQLIEDIRERTRVILDTSGPPLKAALNAKPFMIKPNEDEMANLLNKKLSLAEIAETLRKWRGMEIPIMIVSLGSRGAIASFHGELYRVASPQISEVNAVGSGDAFTAGMAAGLLTELSAEETLRLATAAGAANAMQKRAGHLLLDHVEGLKEQVKVERI